jgi:hypothetical protein
MLLLIMLQKVMGIIMDSFVWNLTSEGGPNMKREIKLWTYKSPDEIRSDAYKKGWKQGFFIGVPIGLMAGAIGYSVMLLAVI